MGMFDHFPYTNFHELNLDWILQALKEIEKTMDQFVAINSLKYADPIQWSIIRQYEKNTIVIDPLTGTAYISVEPVPSGVAITNTDYWTVVFDLGSFVVRAAKNFTDRYEADTTLTATFPSNEGDWLVWGDTLYRVSSNIIAGDQYVIGSNIVHFTMETEVQHIKDLIGVLSDLNTTDKSCIVAAINETIETFNNAIANEVQARQDADATLQDNIDSEAQARQNADNTLQNNIDSEVQARQDADNTLQNNIDSEVQARQDADNALLKRFTDNILNVLDYGAVGDGETDNYDAFQAWIRDVGNTGKIGYIPNGTYLFTHNYTVTYRDGSGANSVTIIGQNRENTILKRADGAAAVILDVRNCDADFSNFTIDLNGANDKDTVRHFGITYVEMTSLHVHEINIINTGFIAVMGYSTNPATRYNYNVNFENVNISGIGAISGSTYPWSIVAADTRQSSFRNMKITGINYYGLEVKNYSTDVNISDIIFENCGHGINFGGDHNEGVPATGYYCRNCNVNNIVCRDVSYPIMANQVFMINCSNISVTGATGAYNFAWLHKCRCMNLDFNGLATNHCDAILYSEGCNEINIDLNGHSPSFAGYLIKNNIANGNHDDNIVMRISGYFPSTDRKVDNPETRIAIINVSARKTYNFAFTNETL